MITAELLKEVHAALVLPNAGNAFLEPLQTVRRRPGD